MSAEEFLRIQLKQRVRAWTEWKSPDRSGGRVDLVRACGGEKERQWSTQRRASRDADGGELETPGDKVERR